MFHTTVRRIAAVLVATAAVAAIAIAIVSSTASATPQNPHHTLYRNFCPLTQADVAAAGPYSPATQSDAKSSRP
jgi:hypothetical protein